MAVREGYKQTEVGVIPEDWDIKSIGDITNVKAGGTPSTLIKAYWDGSIRWMSSGELNYKRIFDVDGRITELGLKNSSASIIPINSVLIGLAGQGKTRGTVAMNYVELCTNQSVAAIFPNENSSQEFIYQYLDSQYEEIRSLSYGEGGRGGLNLRIIKGINIPFPPFPEQKAIATALSDIDGLINSLTKLIEKKKNIKQGAMQELLTGKKRLDGFSGEWIEVKLGDIAKIKTGDKNNENKIEDGKYPFYVRSKHVERINTFSYDCEAIIVPGEGNIGEIFHYVNGKYDLHQRVYGIRNIVEGIHLKYVYYYMAQFFGSYALVNTVKATVDSLRLPTFQKFVIKLPDSKEEQTAIATILSDMDSEIESLQTKLDKYKAIKQGMMQELLTGRIRLLEGA